MTTGVAIFAVAVVGYLLGAVPFSLIIGIRFFGVDVRQHGSGNLGATNVFRLLGAKAGAAALVLDAAKGAVAAAIGIAVSAAFLPHGSLSAEWTPVLGMLSAVLGHSYSPYIGFRGGKGVATSAGALCVITPSAVLIALAVFVAVVLVSRMVSFASITVAFVYPVLTLFLYPDAQAIRIIAFLLAALVLWRHRSNMGRILRGEESKIDFRRGRTVSTPGEEPQDNTDRR